MPCPQNNLNPRGALHTSGIQLKHLLLNKAFPNLSADETLPFLLIPAHSSTRKSVTLTWLHCVHGHQFLHEDSTLFTFLFSGSMCSTHAI
jgi:hypothetical protein